MSPNPGSVSPGIVWLASYPKSGNTWLRVFLANLLSDGPGPVDINSLDRFGISDARRDLYEAASGRALASLNPGEQHRLRPIIHRRLVQGRAGPVFVKTHNTVAMHDGVATISPELTAGAIYVVRHPLDVVLSYAHHFALEIDFAIEAVCNPDNYLDTTENAAFSYLSSWSLHVSAWTATPGLVPCVIRYEDMLERPGETFGAVSRYLGLAPDRAALKRAIRFSSFDVLRAQERKTGFRERGPGGGSFFRSGRAGRWRETLGRGQVARVVAAHGEVMARFGYEA